MNIKELKSHKFTIVNPRYIKKNYLELFNYLNQQYSHIQSMAEKLYWWQNDLSDTPKCPMCGRPTNFDSYTKGYRKWCSYSCMNSDKSKQEKTKQTCRERYGVDNPKKSKNVIEKGIQTSRERYGVDNPAQSDVIKLKIEETNLKRYGVRFVAQSEIMKSKSRQTKQKRYGDPTYTNRPKAVEQTRINNILTRPNVVGYTESGEWICKCPHSDCDKCQEKTFTIKPTHLYDRIRCNTEQCTNLQPIKSMYSSIELWVRSILDKYNIEYESNNRNILNGKELDIYIPPRKLAIECNGVYWHSNKIKNSTYHLRKFESCLEQGIQLITLWEDQIKHKPEIVESVLLSKLGIYKMRIGARECKIREITNKESRDFLKENHIQGQVNAAICIGLLYQGQLYGVMTFNKRSKYSGSKNIHESEWELTRFCTKLNTQITGAASKLMNYFIKTYNPLKIISFSSNDISNGGLYRRLGFHSNMKSSRAYWYINENTLERFHRSSFSKSSLKRKGIDIEGKTEGELMSELPYLKVYDSGHICWEWIKN